MTTPLISTILPTFSPFVLMCLLPGTENGTSLRERVRPRDHLEDLLRDLGLAGAVHGQREPVDELARVLRRVAHRAHPGSELGRGGLEQRAVELGLEVDGEQALEDLLRLRLVDKVAPHRGLVRVLLLRA